ncbi:MAG: hypothetical protein HAW59_04420 [Betaproteobacteria bacterium]|nr:hypothetical protein [Betaproteobacteria bacterium]
MTDSTARQLAVFLGGILVLLLLLGKSLSDEMSVLDACLAPLLWRLKALDIDLGTKGKPVYDYAERLFKKESFQASLTDCEKEYGKK